MPVEKFFEVCIFLWERLSINIFFKNIGHNGLDQILAFFFTRIVKHELQPCECVIELTLYFYKYEHPKKGHLLILLSRRARDSKEP